MRLTFLSLILLMVSLGIHAQSYNIEALESDIYQYTSLEEALAAPHDSVYSLKLKGRLKHIPPEVLTSFPNLQLLDLSKNRIREIPPAIGLLKKLKKLILFKNLIETLPPEFGDLSELQMLIINQNELVSLPMEISKLKKLRYLDMWSNNITVLPRSMIEMPALEEVDLRVIVMTQNEQEAIKETLPNVKIQMDQHCNCGN
jgi:leucine-rich repeat protein SHOC2